MEKNEYMDLLHMLYRVQTNPNNDFAKHKYISASFGSKITNDFPVKHLFLLPRQISEPILKHINDVKIIHFDFQKENEFVFDYYSNHHYKELSKYWKETTEVLHIFSKEKLWGYNEPISEIEKCVQTMEEKWENGIDNYNQEICFIKNNINQFIEKKDEEFIKRIPFEVHNTIFPQLPENIKIKWIKNIISEGRENFIKSLEAEFMKELNIDIMKDEEFEQIFNIFKNKNNEMKWLDINERILRQKEQSINKNKKNEKMDAEKNQKELIIPKGDVLKMEEFKLQELLNNKTQFFEKFIEEKFEKERQEKERQEKEREEKERQEKEREEKEKQIKEKQEKTKIKEEGAKQIVQLGKGRNKEEQLFMACQKGYLYAVQKLLDEGININTKDRENKGKTPLIIAIEENKIEIVRELIKRGADINVTDYDGDTALIIAINKKCVDIVRELIKKGANIHKKGSKEDEPLIIACKEGHLEIIKDLIDNGSNLDEKDSSGNTPLMLSCKFGQLEVVRELIERGADVNAKNNCKETALIIASENGRVEIVKELIKRGADLNAKTNSEMTALMKAVFHHNIDVARELLEMGADANLTDDEKIERNMEIQHYLLRVLIMN